MGPSRRRRHAVPPGRRRRLAVRPDPRAAAGHPRAARPAGRRDQRHLAGRSRRRDGGADRQSAVADRPRRARQRARQVLEVGVRARDGDQPGGDAGRHAAHHPPSPAAQRGRRGARAHHHDCGPLGRRRSGSRRDRGRALARPAGGSARAGPRRRPARPRTRRPDARRADDLARRAGAAPRLPDLRRRRRPVAVDRALGPAGGPDSGRGERRTPSRSRRGGRAHVRARPAAGRHARRAGAPAAGRPRDAPGHQRLALGGLARRSSSRAPGPARGRGASRPVSVWTGRGPRPRRRWRAGVRAHRRHSRPAGSGCARSTPSAARAWAP